jgi:hypothetical protein
MPKIFAMGTRVTRFVPNCENSQATKCKSVVREAWLVGVRMQACEGRAHFGPELSLRTAWDEAECTSECGGCYLTKMYRVKGGLGI